MYVKLQRTGRAKATLREQSWGRALTKPLIKTMWLWNRISPEQSSPTVTPPSHGFLWGPRAFAETTKLKVLQFFASITKTHPRAYPEKYAEALKDEIDRTEAWIFQRMIQLLWPSHILVPCQLDPSSIRSDRVTDPFAVPSCESWWEESIKHSTFILFGWP